MRAQDKPAISTWRTPAAGVLSGLLFALAFPPLEWVLLLPLALVPWILTLSAERSRVRALVSGLLFGLAYWSASIPWIFYVVTHYGGQSSVMGVVCVVILAAILAEWPAIVGWGVAACAPPDSSRRLAAFPLLWMAAEHARSFVYGGFPWNLTGQALYRHPVWTQSASVWGVYGVGLAVTATSTLLAASVRKRRAGPALSAAVLALILGVGGALRLAGGNREAGAPLSAAVLQPNLSQESRLAPGGGERNYIAVLLAARAAASEKPSLLVIPESAFPTYWDRSERMRRDISEIAGESGGAVLFNDIEEEPDGRYYNVARLAGPLGPLGKPYRKVHLVPFGEYVPLPKIFFFVRQVSTEIGAFSSAERPSTIVSGALSVGVGVCYEILYPSLAREEVAQGANLLATISNDSWYGRAGAQPQHFAGAVLRAVENNRYLLRAAITGISGIVDEKGRIRRELPENRPGILHDNVRLFDARTVWTRWGYWLPRLSTGAALAVLLLGVARLFGSTRADS